MDTIRIGKLVAERYNDKGISYIRVKYNDVHRTEILMQESEFERVYGKFDGWEVIFERINLFGLEEWICIKSIC